MNTWKRTIIVGAALLAGCEGSIGTGKQSSGSGSSSGSGTAGSVGTGNTVGTGTAGSGTAGTTVVPPPVEPDGVHAGHPRDDAAAAADARNTTTRRASCSGSTSQPSSMLAPDTLGSVDQRAWDGFQTAADSLATQVMANATAQAKVLPCTAATATACMRDVHRRRSGSKAFRRPLTTAEVTPLHRPCTRTARRSPRAGRSIRRCR